MVNEGLARGIAPAVFPRDGVTAEAIDSARREVAHAAGLASNAVPLTGQYMVVQGAATVDPIANWHTITKPKPLLEADDILAVCGYVTGHLEAMAVQAEAERPPAGGTQGMHPLVWGVAARLWRNEHYGESVAAAAEAVVGSVKRLTKRNDVAESGLWQEVFSDKEPTPGKPRLRWPGDPMDRDVSTMTNGLRSFAPGVQMTIRNPSAHGATELDEQTALERLAALCLLMRWVDECILVEAAEQPHAP